MYFFLLLMHQVLLGW